MNKINAFRVYWTKK